MHPPRSVRDMTHHPSNSEIKKPRQHIPFRAQAHLHHSEFEWRAFTGPLGLITVVDALKNGEADLEVRLLRHVRIASVKGGASSAKGEIMRYLAEIAWAPDAIRKRRRASSLRDAMKIGPPVVLEEGRWDDGRGVGI